MLIDNCSQDHHQLENPLIACQQREGSSLFPLALKPHAVIPLEAHSVRSGAPRGSEPTAQNQFPIVTRIFERTAAGKKQPDPLAVKIVTFSTLETGFTRIGHDINSIPALWMDINRTYSIWNSMAVSDHRCLCFSHGAVFLKSSWTNGVASLHTHIRTHRHPLREHACSLNHYPILAEIGCQCLLTPVHLTFRQNSIDEPDIDGSSKKR